MALIGLDIEQHHNLKLLRQSSFEFAVQFNLVALVANEFALAALNYPILFVEGQSGFVPVALLSLVSDENQYVQNDQWQAAYVPAGIRTYPFRLAGEHVLIDDTAPHLSVSEGDALFTDEGQATLTLQNVLAFLRESHAAEEQTKKWCQQLASLDLFEKQNVLVTSPEGQRYQLEDFYVIAADKITLLPDSELIRLVRDDSLAKIYAHQGSLEHLLKLAIQRDKLTTSNPEVLDDETDAFVEIKSTNTAKTRKTRA